MKSVQTDLVFEETSESYVAQLERKITIYLAKKIEEERRNSPEAKKMGNQVNWDRKFSEKIKTTLLTTFENFKYAIRVPNFPEDFKVQTDDIEDDKNEIMKKAIADLHNIKEVTYIKNFK